MPDEFEAVLRVQREMQAEMPVTPQGGIPIAEVSRGMAMRELLRRGMAAGTGPRHVPTSAVD